MISLLPKVTKTRRQMPDSRPSDPIVYRRRLASVASGQVRVLDAIGAADGRVTVIIGGGGLPGGAPGPDRAGCLRIEAVTEASGGAILTGRAAGGATLLALAVGEVALDPIPEETGLLAGRNVLLGLRIAESPGAAADWIAWHAEHHGADGAVILNRDPEDGEAFAAALTQALGPSAAGLRVIVVECPIPLGDPALGPESHPFLAPDAPGKDRMERPAPDPWRSPLREGLVLEALKWRFLVRARAVLTLDPCDRLVPAGPGGTAFDRCRTAESGVILLSGRRAYPWRARPRRALRFADHICRPFDARRGIARWGVAPDIAGPDRVWRPARVGDLRPDAADAPRFWRAMALRVPGQRPATLAPKTALIEDAELLDISQRILGHDPVRPPTPATSRAEVAPKTDHPVTIVTAMKNEGPFILEWIAHHRAIGVDRFLIYTNDCTDGTDTLLRALSSRGLVEHRENPYRAMNLTPQHAALESAEAEAAVRDAAWIIAMDVDEFINVKVGDGTLSALFAKIAADAPGSNMIALTWRLFGNADIEGYEDRFVTEQFGLCAPELARKPHQAWGFKTLFRNEGLFRKLGVHRPKGLRAELWEQVRWINGSGRAMPREVYRNGWRSTTATYGYDWVCLNHYAVRSAESFLVKRERGRVNHVDRDQGLNYWFRMNFNSDTDASIARLAPRVRAEWAQLMADPEIKALHGATVAAHRAKIAELKAREDQAAFLGELTGERMRALSRMLQHFGAAVFSAGPRVIPEGLHRQTLPPDFFFTVAHDGEAEH
jgi:Glycosyl transferase family 2